MKNEIILFENQDVKLEINMNDETVWLSLDQMAELFDRDKSVISRHIKKAMEEELENSSVIANFATTASDGKIYKVDYYNLDVIISVGYRVKSKNGIAFRRWANKILKDYMLKGYAVNQRRLEYLEKTIKLIDIVNRMDDSSYNIDAKEILKVIGNYSKALNLLDDYDYKTISKIKGNKSEEKIEYKECINVINTLRFNEESDLFALERKQGLKTIIGNLYQTFDGNKRIAATLFIYFLQFYNILYK